MLAYILQGQGEVLHTDKACFGVFGQGMQHHLFDLG
jgi:hypothetical protein